MPRRARVQGGNRCWSGKESRHVLPLDRAGKTTSSLLRPLRGIGASPLTGRAGPRWRPQIVSDSRFPCGGFWGAVHRPHVLLGHSHGGNVILSALTERIAGRVTGVACLSTPFLHVVPRDYSEAALAFTLAVPAGFFLLMGLVLGFLEVKPFLWFTWQNDESEFFLFVPTSTFSSRANNPDREVYRAPIQSVFRRVSRTPAPKIRWHHSLAHYSSQCRLDLYGTARHPHRRSYLRTSRPGPSFGSARCQLGRRTYLQLIGIHA
jgi:hypothetical protein